jgi:hypothetical protein
MRILKMAVILPALWGIALAQTSDPAATCAALQQLQVPGKNPA